MLEYFKAVLYGIVEGVTEWLPISSTGHLILLGDILSLNCFETLGEEYRSMFDVVIQLFAVLAVAVYYSRQLIPTKRQALTLWSKLILATLPAAFAGILADKLCENYLGKSIDGLLFTPQVVASALIIYGILFILVERLTKATVGRQGISAASSLAIGCFQTLAIIPGTSRSGATILGGRIIGISRESAARFSFFAAIPAIGGASLIKLYDFGKYMGAGSAHIPTDALFLLLTAGITAFAVSLLTIRFLTDFVKKHSFVPFGIYRIILGISVLIF